MTVYTFACFLVMRFVPRHIFRRASGEESPENVPAAEENQ
jgi:hypothetical protein